MKTSTAAVTLLSLALSASARAAILGTTGNVDILATPPVSVNDGALESNTTLFAFAEQQNLVLTQTIPVDMSVPGSIPASPSNDNYSPATIPIGTEISSDYFHFDVVGTPGTPIEFKGSITFTSDVLGIILNEGTLNETRTYPGLPTTTYSSISGLEINTSAGPDSVSLTADRRTVIVDFLTGTSVDDIRVITAAPEPASLSLLTLAAAPLLLRRRRR